MKQLSRRRRKQQLRDQAFVRSLFVVFILTLIAFVPFGISRIVETYHGLSVEVAISVTLMLFSNNAVNWIVYGVMNRSFRRGYVTLVPFGHILRC
nr:hypothetical protein BaRGS_022728 [Batillaria attramentaria]